jgi:glutamyl-tRNA reductase
MNTKDRQHIQDFWAIGINYKKTDASLRGSFAVNNEQYDQLIASAPSFGINEFFVLSTCNRTEIYGFASSSKQLTSFLCSVTSGDEQTFKEISYTKNDRQAISHLFSVAAGLDSQILGDYEILGQIKIAVKNAKAGGFVGPFMERLINCVLQASKAIKTHTALSGGTVSVSFAAVQYIREFFEGPTTTPKMKCPSTAHMMTQATIEHYVATNRTNIEDKKILLLGTGKIGKSTCRNLVDYLNTHNITLMNRTEQTAASLAEELGLRMAPMANLEAELASADIILVSTSASEPVVQGKHLANAGDKLVIDFSIPCNVAADAQELPNVTVVDVDVLSKIKDETLAQRRNEVPKAITIINEIIAEFIDWCEMRKHVPVLKEVKSKLKEICIVPVFAMANEGSLRQHDGSDEKIQKVINSLAIKIRKNNTLGCHYIQAINEYMA